MNQNSKEPQAFGESLRLSLFKELYYALVVS